jgi:glutaredoxin
MDTLARRLLCAFDVAGRPVLALREFHLAAAETATVSREALRRILQDLVAQGFLRAAEGAEQFVRTEDGRLAVAGPLDVTLYTRAGCHLCEEAKQQMAPLLREFGARLREVDVDSDPALRERHTNDVPVIFLAARKVAKHRVDLAQLRRQLAQASSAPRRDPNEGP